MKKFTFGFFIILLFIGLYWYLEQQNMFSLLLDNNTLQQTISNAGIWGPIIIIGTITLAIVMSPIPSAPVALASGAIYGHLWGSLYILAGSFLGATIAFFIARLLGQETLKKYFNKHLTTGLLGSQNTLMVIIFGSRLLPFISFDMISYAAGLTTITFWRFALATITGIIPASFLLGHFGSEIASAEMNRIAFAILLLGLITLLPLIIKKFLNKIQKKSSNNTNSSH